VLGGPAGPSPLGPGDETWRKYVIIGGFRGRGKGTQGQDGDAGGRTGILVHISVGDG